MGKTTKTIIGLIIVAIVIWGGYSLLTKESNLTESIKIGAILPLTGDLATYAEGVQNAINLAIEDSGFQDKIQLIVEDDFGCESKDDVSAAQKLVNIDKVKGIIGPICSGSVLAVASIAESNGVVLISPSATSKSISDVGNYIFRTIASDVDKGIAVAEYAYNKGYNKAALLIDNSNDVFVQQRIDIQETFKAMGGQIAVDEFFAGQTSDFRSQLTKIKNSNAETIFIGVMPNEAGLILKQAKELGISLSFISADNSFGTQDVIDIAGDTAEGIIFADTNTPDNKEYIDFNSSYESKYGQEPSAYAAEGYDAAMLLIKSIAAASDKTGESIAEELYKVGKNYYGASGIITFDENGDVQKPMVIKTIVNGQAVEAE